MKKTLMLSLALTLLVLGVPHLIAGEGPGDDKPMDHSGMMAEGEPGGESGDMGAMHEKMMARHQKMLDEMKQEQAKLAELAAAIDDAENHDQQIKALSAALQELISQHQARMAQRIEMMETMGDGGMGMMGGMHHGGKKPHGDMRGHGSCSHCKGKKKGHHGEHGMKGDCPHGGDCPKCDGDCPHKGECPKCKSGDCPHHQKKMDGDGSMEMEVETESMEMEEGR